MASGGTQVASLFGTLGLQVNQSQWAKGAAQIQSMSGMLKSTTGLQGTALQQALRSNSLVVSTQNANYRSLIASHQKAQGVVAAGSKEMSRAFAGIGVEAARVGLGIARDLVGEAGSALIDFNEQVQNAKISLSAMLQGNLGGDWASATRNADALYLEWQKFSTTTPVTTQEMLEFGRSVAVATFQAGGKIKDLTTITEMGTVAAKTLGANSQYAALELTEMLQGNVSRRMRFAQQLLGMAHVTEDQFRAMDAKQRLATVTKVLTSEPMQQANKAMAESFTGVTSTLKDKLQIAFGRVGLPLFKAVTDAVAGINTWLERNAETIGRIADTVGGVLASAFGTIRDLALQAYVVFANNRAVIERIAAAVWHSLVTAFQVVAASISYAYDQIDAFLKFLDTGAGKFLSQVLLLPGLLVQVSDGIGGIGKAFEAIGSLTVVKELMWLAQQLDDLLGTGGPDTADGNPEGYKRSPAMAAYLNRTAQSDADDASWAKIWAGMPSARLTSGAASGGGRGPVALSAQIGDIHVHSASSDPLQVAHETRKAIDSHLGDLFRQAYDVVVR